MTDLTANLPLELPGYCIRDYDHTTIGRFRRYWENPDILAGLKWERSQPPFWVGADTLDVLRGLGYSEADIRRLKDRAVI